MDDKTIATAGQLICIDEGEYSDYSVIGFFVVLQDFDPFEQLKIFAPCPEDVAPINQTCNVHKFLAHLLKQGCLLEIEYTTLYLGSYGRVKDVTFG